MDYESSGSDYALAALDTIYKRASYNNFTLSSDAPGVTDRQDNSPLALYGMTHAAFYWHGGNPIDEVPYEVIDEREGRRIPLASEEAEQVGALILGASITDETLGRVSDELKALWEAEKSAAVSSGTTREALALERSRLLNFPFAVGEIGKVARSQVLPLGAIVARLWTPYDVPPRRVLARLKHEMRRLNAVTAD